MAERRTESTTREETAPAAGRAASGHQESIQSAPTDAEIPDALGNKPERVQSPALADKTQVKEFGTDERTGLAITAAATDMEKAEPGPYGMALPQSGEVAGGNIKAVLEAPPNDQTASHPLTKEQAAMMTPVYRKIVGLSGRPPAEMGLLGPGDIVRGHMLLLDLHTGEKVRAMDGHRINKGELYANLRNLPESLATGDTIKRVLGAD